MSVTVAEIKQWIADGGLSDESVVTLDGDGVLVADVPGKVAVTYLHIGFAESDEPEEIDRIDGIPGGVGELVFWKTHESPAPWWIAEWQPDNGRVFAIVNAAGDVGTAQASELSRDFRNAARR